MFEKVRSVTPLKNYKLCIVFYNGVTKIYDVSKLFKKYKMFEEIQSEEIFNSVFVDTGGYGIAWNDNVDISCNELWNNGKKISTPFEGLLSFSEASLLWNLNESTLRKAVSYGKLINGLDVCKFGHQWVVSIESMKKNYGLPSIKK